MSKISNKLIDITDEIIKHFKLPDDEDTFNKIQEIIIEQNLNLNVDDVIHFFKSHPNEIIKKE